MKDAGVGRGICEGFTGLVRQAAIVGILHRPENGLTRHNVLPGDPHWPFVEQHLGGALR